MIRSYQPHKGRLRLSKYHCVADYWTQRTASIKLSDDLARVVSQLEATLGEPVTIVYGFATRGMAETDKKKPAHSKGTAVDIAPPSGISFETVLIVLETLLDGQGGIGWHKQAGKKAYIHVDVESRRTRWVWDTRRRVRIPVPGFRSDDDTNSL